MVFVPVTPEEGAKSSLPPIGRATTPRGISRGSSRSSSRGSVRPARQPTNARTARGSRSERRYVKVLKPDEVPLSARLATFHAGTPARPRQQIAACSKRARVLRCMVCARQFARCSSVCLLITAMGAAAGLGLRRLWRSTPLQLKLSVCYNVMYIYVGATNGRVPY